MISILSLLFIVFLFHHLVPSRLVRSTHLVVHVGPALVGVTQQALFALVHRSMAHTYINNDSNTRNERHTTREKAKGGSSYNARAARQGLPRPSRCRQGVVEDAARAP